MDPAESLADWVEGPTVDQVPEGRPFRLDLSGDESALIVRLGERLASFVNTCPHQDLPLDGGEIDLETGVLRCPWHGWEFNALTGQGRSLPACQLQPLPLRVQHGRIWIRSGG